MIAFVKTGLNELDATALSLSEDLPQRPFRYRLAVPIDPLYSSDLQWHLGYVGSFGFLSVKSAAATGGIEAVWADYQGDGIGVGVWDDGILRTHWDLSANYDSTKHVTISGVLNDGQPLTVEDGHGTSVAGLIAADDNSRGGVGIAHDVRITAIRIFGGIDDINNAWYRYLQTLDSLSQFDVTNHSYGGYPDFHRYGDVSKFEAAAVSGRRGLGTVNVKSAGNINIDGNGEALDASRFTVTVAAIGNNSSGNIASYSTYGAHVLVSAPAAAVTTDLPGSTAGYNGLLNDDYTNVFGGTSAAAPVTAGVIALMLDANPNLGWRDVQNILTYSAIGVGSLYGGSTTNENFAWQWNGAGNWNGGGLHFSEDYGYGMVNAFNAVRMAEVWGILHAQAESSANEVGALTGTLLTNQAITDLDTSNYRFRVEQDIVLEHVALTVSLTHAYFPELRLRLISPQGTILTVYDGSTGNAATADGTFTYTFGAEGFRGESSAGEWIAQIQDVSLNGVGVLKSVSFTGYGAATENNSVYHYTDEILQVMQLPGQSGRMVLADLDGGTDWIDAATMASDLVLKLTNGSTSTAGNSVFMNIAAETLIENAIGGDGDDLIEGNDTGNIIYGMRGDDVLSGLAGDDHLFGGAGTDIAVFRGLRSDYQITYADGLTTVAGQDGVDVQSGFEILRFDDGEIADPSAALFPPDQVAPALVSSVPADNATAVTIGANIVLTFNEAVKAGAGAISLYQENGALFQRFASEDVLYSGNTVSIDPAVNLSKDASYYLQIDADAILDLTGNAFAGISDSSMLNFSTESSITVINGTAGNDRLTGYSGGDLIQGFGGADTLNGKLGADTLNGGGGKDFFVFDTALGGSNIETIGDYRVRDDTIRIENSIFTKLTKTGSLSSSYFRANPGATALDSNDYILFDTVTGKVYYDADGNGVGATVHFMTLVGIAGGVTANEFLVT